MVRFHGSTQARTSSWPSSLEYSRYSAAPSQMLRVRHWSSWRLERGERESKDFITVRRCEIAGEDTADWICAAMNWRRMGGEILWCVWLLQLFLEKGIIHLESQAWKGLLGVSELMVKVWRIAELNNSGGGLCESICLGLRCLERGTHC